MLSAPGSVLIKTTLVKEARYRQLYQQTDKSANRFLVWGPTLPLGQRGLSECLVLFLGKCASVGVRYEEIWFPKIL